MREIKFRAWNLINEEMVVNSELETSELIDVFKNEDLEVMQYTGLKDKSGVEIYEGDIIAIKDTIRKEIWVSDIIFEDATFVVKSKGCEYYDSPLGGIASDKNHKGTHFCKVIGNIYENPDLLEG